MKTGVYERIKDRTKTLVIGRKGSGKSALCLMLNRQLCNEDKVDSCIVTPDAISAEEIRRFEMVGVNEQQSKKLVWQYLFLIQICKFLLSTARQTWASEADWPLELKKVRRFLVDNHEVDDLNFQEKFWKVINRIRATLKLDAFGTSLEIGVKDSSNEGLQLSTQLDFLESWLTPQLQKLQQQHKLYILTWVDTHVGRVSKRLGLIGPKVNADQAHTVFAKITLPDWAYGLHVGLIRHGRQICHAQRPKFGECPLYAQYAYVGSINPQETGTS